MTEILSLKGVNKSYFLGVQTQVLFDINLKVRHGSFLSIVGQSGSGKSTLLNIIGTLDKPTTDEVYINGERTDTMDNNHLAILRNQTLGFVFQFHYLLPEFTAYENIVMPYRIAKGAVDANAKKRAYMLMEMMDITAVKDNIATRMSGGQQQRTAIARALMNNPKMVLADEPTGNLDTASTDRVYSLFRKINEDMGTTFIVITHDQNVAERTDRIVEITDGRIALDITA
ncbi:MAG TPA: ABC transporter ATP-binding protein [Euryarchaeota archaeon]|nr:ABC transporter ATP-binding protein [Euryarchaeota archaeon]